MLTFKQWLKKSGKLSPKRPTASVKTDKQQEMYDKTLKQLREKLCKPIKEITQNQYSQSKS